MHLRLGLSTSILSICEHICTYTPSAPSHDCETSFRMGIMNVAGADDKNTYVSQGVVALHMQRPQHHRRACIYTCNNSIRRTRLRPESMTSCQSRNGNLAAKRGTSQLPATANNLGRSRSSAIYERVYPRRDDNRKSPPPLRSTRLYFGGNIAYIPYPPTPSRPPPRPFPSPLTALFPIVILYRPSYYFETTGYYYRNSLRIISGEIETA